MMTRFLCIARFSHFSRHQRLGFFRQHAQRAKKTSSATQNKASADIAALKESIDTKLNTVSQHVVNLETKLARESKLLALAFGIDHVDLNSFKYHDSQTIYNGESSSDLVCNILLSFRQNAGYYLPDGTMEMYELLVHKEERLEQSRKEFHDELIYQIHSLIGQKPRISKQNDGRYAIYYS